MQGMRLGNRRFTDALDGRETGLCKKGLCVFMCVCVCVCLCVCLQRLLMAPIRKGQGLADLRSGPNLL
jgi:hypothetical protein